MKYMFLYMINNVNKKKIKKSKKKSHAAQALQIAKNGKLFLGM